MEKYSSYKDSGEKWLGMIPGHWEMVRNKSFFTERKKCVGSDSHKYTLLSLTKKGVIIRNLDDGGKYPTDFNTYKVVEPGDFVFCLFDVDETPRTVGLAQNHGMITGAYTILRQNKINDKYLLYYYLSIDDQKALRPLYTGLRKVVQTSAFMAMKICIPPLPEQGAIVSYLDRVTGDIDRAIAESQRMIDLLNERKQIIIQHAVTKGLNPNAKLKYSGVEWIGDVPEGWEVRKLRYLCKIKTGDKDTIMRVEDGEYPFFVRSPKIERINSYTFDTEAILMAGDGAGAGRIFHYYKGKFGCHQRVYCLHDFSVDVYPQFLYYQLSHFFKEVFLGVSAKSTVDSVRLPMLKDFQIVFPNVNEQQQIVEYIEKALEPLSQAIASAERKIALLRERKQIIINEVVTGKVKVS